MDGDTIDSEILDRLFRPDRPFPSKAAAKAVLQFDLAEEDRARMKELAAKARAGQLTPADQAAVDAYTRVGCWLSILRSKARRTLNQQNNSKRRRASTES